MNILVVSENYLKGGLETHINTYYELINKDNNVIFAFANYEDNGYLKNAKIVTGFKFAWNSSINDFCNDVKKLVKIIKENNIELVHVHPFYSIFPAVFAANLTNTKLVYTYHGYGSINFISSYVDTILFTYAIDQRINKIFCVADNIIEYFNELHSHNVVFLPNIIDEDIYYSHDVLYNKKWALISRIDIDKYTSITKFLDMLPKLDIDYVDIYGNGSMLEQLGKYIENHKLQKKVKLKGFNDNIYESLNDYTGTIGIGRVTAESLCMNYPSILIGYDKVVGVIDDEIYNKTKNINFVPASLDDISVEDFNKQLNEINNKNISKYQFRKNIIQDFGKNNVKVYLTEIKNISNSSLAVINNMYESIDLLKEKEDMFYKSIDVYNIVSSQISSQTRNLYLKNMINIYNIYTNYLNNQNNFDNKLTNLNMMVERINSELINEINEYRNGKLYKISKKIYSLKSKVFKKKKKNSKKGKKK